MPQQGRGTTYSPYSPSYTSWKTKNQNNLSDKSTFRCYSCEHINTRLGSHVAECQVQAHKMNGEAVPPSGKGTRTVLPPWALGRGMGGTVMEPDSKRIGFLSRQIKSPMRTFQNHFWSQHEGGEETGQNVRTASPGDRDSTDKGPHWTQAAWGGRRP